MSKQIFLIAVVTLAAAGIANAQYPIMDMVANKVIQKYQSASCEQLWKERAEGKGKPKPQGEQDVIQMLHQDPQMREAFFKQVAAPIVSKMFECGMVP